MNFAESTQLRNWQFSADRLRQQREENRQRSLGALQQITAPSSSTGSLETLESQTSGVTPTADGPEPLSQEEELALLKYYGSRLQHVCRELRLPRRVLGTASTYLKRIYLAFSCMEQDPQQLLLTCLYLACKIEEHYISAAELGRLTGVPADLILRTELAALQGLQFDLIVHSPYKAIDGFFEDIKDAAAEAGSSEAAAAAAGLDPGMAGLTDEQLGKARAVAYSSADALLLSDAPLLHTPGRVALAALRSGFSKLGIKLHKYLERVAERSSSSGGGGSGSDQQAVLARLQAALVELDKLGAEGAKSVEADQMAAIDRKLKACRAALLEGGGAKQAAAAKAKAKAEKAARKVAKAAEQRSAAEAAVGILPAAPAEAAGVPGGEQPPSKRPRQDGL